MGGDLNTKKSWHPHRRLNQERVWKEEKNALAERQLIERLRREREEERAVEELQRLQEKSGGKVPVKRVDWMYNGPSSNDAVTEEREAYLLGKRRVDNLLKDDTESLKKGATVGIDAVGQPTATTARDTQKKVLEDPLLLIQKQKMEMQMKQAKAALKAKQYEEKRAKEKERERRHKHRHHHHSRRDRSRSASADYDDRERRHHRSRRGDDRDDRHRRRSRSPRRDDRAARRDSGDNYRQRSRSRSRSPYRKSHREENNYRKRSRSRSPRRRDYDDDRDSSHRRRDRSPARRSHEDHHRRPRRPSPPQTHSSTKETAAPAPGPSAAERLAAMQADASSLEDQRLERLRQLEQDVAAEEEKRRNDRGGKERFISGVRNRAADGMDLGDAIARGRQGLSREVGA